MAGTNPTNPTKAQARKLAREIAEWLMYNGYYFVNVDDSFRSVFVCLTYRDVTINEVETHMLPEHYEKVRNVKQMTRSVQGGTGFSYVEIVIIDE